MVSDITHCIPVKAEHSYLLLETYLSGSEGEQKRSSLQEIRESLNFVRSRQGYEGLDLSLKLLSVELLPCVSSASI